MVFIYSASGIYVADAYNVELDPFDDKYVNALKLEFNTSTKEVSVVGKDTSTGQGTQTVIADADVGQGPTGGGLTVQEVQAEIDSLAVTKQQVGFTGVQTIYGDISVAGDVTASHLLATSDRRLKSDIERLDAAPAGLSALGVYAYRLRGRECYGVMAQECLKNDGLRRLVFQGESHLSVDYAGLCALLLKQVQDLERRLQKMESRSC